MFYFGLLRRPKLTKLHSFLYQIYFSPWIFILIKCFYILMEMWKCTVRTANIRVGRTKHLSPWYKKFCNVSYMLSIYLNTNIINKFFCFSFSPTLYFLKQNNISNLRCFGLVLFQNSIIEYQIQEIWESVVLLLGA